MSYQKTIILGFVGNDPEVKTLNGGAKVARFSIAVSESFTRASGEKVEETEWFDIQCWEGKADMIEKYLIKGQELLIEGRVKTQTWDDKDGRKQSRKIVIANVIQFAGGIKKTREQAPAPTISATVKESAPATDDSDITDDLPF